MRLMPLLLALACTPDPADTDTADTDTQQTGEPWRRIKASEAMAVGPEVQIVDVRALSDFESTHVEGALHLDADLLRETVDGVGSQVPPRADAEAIFEDAGLVADAPILVMDRTNDTTPARVLWTLGLYGASELLLLDGGLEAWVAEGVGMEPGAPDGSTSSWDGEATRETLVVDKAWMLEHLDDPDVAIFDVRTTDEYEEGHIPGAVLVDWTTNLGGDGLFLSEAAVRTNHGEPTASTLVVYCRSGSRASVSWAVLATAGYDDVRLYDGSWLEWGDDPDTPKTTGSAP